MFSIEPQDADFEDVYRKQVVVGSKMCSIELIDTAGKERYATAVEQWVRYAYQPFTNVSMYFRLEKIRQGQGFLLVYSVASRTTFDQIETFFQTLQRLISGDFVCFLVGNKCDKMYEREVSTEEGAALALKFGCEFIETSARTRQNVERLFTDLIRSLRQQRDIRVNRERAAQEKDRKMKKCII
ncbi:P-loop containing nucleoside triphosphate hydrolase protein, partial [Crassisporium funariophilum]